MVSVNKDREDDTITTQSSSCLEESINRDNPTINTTISTQSEEHTKCHSGSQTSRQIPKSFQIGSKENCIPNSHEKSVRKHRCYNGKRNGKRKFKCLRRFFHCLTPRGWTIDNTIDTDFPTLHYIRYSEMEEQSVNYLESHKESPALTQSPRPNHTHIEEKKQNYFHPTAMNPEDNGEYKKSQVQTIPSLNASPHYVHHIEMEEKKLKYLLARRSCHLPGNNWWQDWLQYIANNHPLLGLCLHHKKHPLTLMNRLYILLASISFGLIATNFVYLFFLTTDNDFEKDIIRLNFEVNEGFAVEAILTSGMAMLFTINGILHFIFDFCMWHLSAATCFHHLKNYKVMKKCGSYTLVAISLVLFLLATQILMLRMSYNINAEQGVNEWKDILQDESLLAMLGYIIELSLVYFVINPVLVTILFSGVLGCIPGLGGRPRDIQRALDSTVEERIKYYSGKPEHYFIV